MANFEFYFNLVIFVTLTLSSLELQGSAATGNRVKRALFSTGKFLNSKVQIDAENHKQSKSNKGSKASSETAESLLASLLKVNKEIEDEEKRLYTKPKPIITPVKVPKITIPKISKEFSAVLRKFFADPSSLPDLSYDNEGEDEESIPLIGDRTAETVCEIIKHEKLPKDLAEYLLVPLKQVNYQGSELNLATFDKVWFERGCYSWKLESCEGYSRFPLEQECKFWNPIATENPGCPKLDRRIKIDWRTLTPKNCTCKYPCTLKYASVQECYLPDVTQPKILPNTDERITMGLETIRYLCKAVSQIYGVGTSVGIKWIPIKLRMSLDDENNVQKQESKNCIHYTFIPCPGNNNERRKCGKWIKEEVTCNTDEENKASKRSLNSKEIDKDTLQCPCELPCLRIFDSINKCNFFEEIGTELGISSDELKTLKPSEMFKKGSRMNEFSNRIIECNYFEKNVHCTVIPKYEEVMSNSKRSRKRIGNVKCSYVDAKPSCPFVWNY